MRPAHYQMVRRRRRRRGPIALVILVIAIVVVVLIRAETLSVPDLRTGRLIGTSVRFPGAEPRPAWPKQGEAAVGVVGLDRFRSQSQKPTPTASVAKIMTAYVVLRDHPLAVGQDGFKLTIDSADVSEYLSENAELQSTVPVADGEVLDESQLLEALLIPSGNNIAELLAQYDAGSDKAFVARMNREASRLGMHDTTYTDPSGFAASTVSTAADQVLLAEAAIREPVLDRIVAMRTVSLPVAGTVTNFDSLLGHDGFVGIKTGSDSTAGGCFVFADHQIVDKRHVTVVGAILGLDRGQMNTTTLLDAALHASVTLVGSVTAAMSTRTTLPAGTLVAEVTNAQGKRVRARTTTALQAFGLGGMTLRLSVTLAHLGHRLGRGQSVGSVTVGRAADNTTPATATTAMPTVTFGWRLRHIL